MESGRNSRIKTHHELLHSRDFLCCCCFHVRTGTIALGLVHLMMQMIIVAVLATAVLNPDALSLSKTAIVQSGMDSEQEHQETLMAIAALIRHSKQDLVSAVLLSTLTGLISMLFVYGAFWGHPPYLLPFFAIFCCDFATTMLRLIGSFAEHHSAPHSRDGPLHGFYLMMTVIIKAYLLNMIWSCYKFLRLRQELIRNPPVAMSSQPAMTTRPAAMEANQLLPDYEATQKYPYNFYAAPPPSYNVAMQMPTVVQAAVVPAPPPLLPPPSYDNVAGTSRQVELASETLPSEASAAVTGSAASTVNVIHDGIHDVIHDGIHDGIHNVTTDPQSCNRSQSLASVTNTEGIPASQDLARNPAELQDQRNFVPSSK